MRDAWLAFLIRLITGVRLCHLLPAGPGARVYFANHSSHLDFIVIWAALPDELRRRVRPVAGADYWEKGRVRPWLARAIFRAVLIPRGAAVKRGHDPIGAMARVLEEGEDLIVFPEGTRSRDGRVAEFKPGLHALARRVPGTELVPVYLENLSRILPKGEFLPAPLLGSATFGPPCEAPAEGEERCRFLTRAREAVLRLAGIARPSPEAHDHQPERS